jgi:hypothetical protein
MGGLPAGLTVGLVAGLVVLLTIWLGVLLSDAIARPAVDPNNLTDPVTCWRQERQVNLALGLVLGFSGGLPFGLALRLTGQLGLGLGGCLVFGLARRPTRRRPLPLLTTTLPGRPRHTV